MIRTFKFALKPTSKQIDKLNAALALHCEIYNAALEHRITAYRKAKVSISFNDQCAELPAIKQVRPDVAELHAQAIQQTLHRLDLSFKAFFRRAKAGAKPGFPRFKAARRFDSMVFPQPPSDGGLRNDTVYIPKIGYVKLIQHRNIPEQARIKQVKIHRTARKWFVLFVCEQVPARSFDKYDNAVGIDLGVTHLATTSTGIHIPNPKYFARLQSKIAVTQRHIAKCKRGSSRRRKAVNLLASLSARVRRQRLDNAHKVALDLVRTNQFIVHEDLQIKNMVLRPHPIPLPDGSFEPNNASRKAGLNRSILDAGWHVLLKCLHEKAEEAVREVIAVDPRYTSQQCSNCGYISSRNRLTQADFKCISCGHSANADHNAAVNVLRAGLVLRGS